jgi:hypothetical protein
MQTFLPYPDFALCALVLDSQRLGKQRVEVVQILRALRGETRGWRNHPATRMWKGHLAALGRYGLAICAEWVDRGYRDNQAPRIHDLALRDQPDAGDPAWLGDMRLHTSHRAALLCKAPAYYGRYEWGDVPATYTYYWPGQED